MPPGHGDSVISASLDLTRALGKHIEDAEEGAFLFATIPRNPADRTKETFLVFSQDIPSDNLGFTDSTACSIDVAIGSHDFTIRQSPGLLRSNAEAGTTGAVLWKVTPLVAAWLINKGNIFWKESILTDAATVLELGCGISGLIGLSMAPFLSKYILTDQHYVMKLLRQNVAANQPSSTVARPKRKTVADVAVDSGLEILTLDWETDSAVNVCNALGGGRRVNMLVACDCIYNDFLVKPFVQMCLDICALWPHAPSQFPTVVLIAQQLRSDEVFLEWLRAMMNGFYVWRIPNECLSKELQSGSGYALHLALRKEEC
jgi:hypothetical protein